MRGWLASGALGVVASGPGDPGPPLGFALLSRGLAPAGSRRGLLRRWRWARGEVCAELLAIAVTAESRGQGVGRRLIERAIVEAAALPDLTLRELRLAVADDNAAARHLFDSAGFQLLPGDHGSYEGGQPVLHMRRPL